MLTPAGTTPADELRCRAARLNLTPNEYARVYNSIEVKTTPEWVEASPALVEPPEPPKAKRPRRQKKSVA